MKNPKTVAIQFLFTLIPIAISLFIAAMLVGAAGRDPIEVVETLEGRIQRFAETGWGD